MGSIPSRSYTTMKRCKHSLWLRLSSTSDDQALIAYSDRARRLLNDSNNPLTTSPTLIVLVGNAYQRLALNKMFQLKLAKKKLLLGEVHLHLAPSSVFQERPIIIAESHPTIDITADIAQPGCHKTTKYMIGPERNTREVLRGLYTQLLYPFSDVFCLFSNDLGGLRGVAKLVSGWLEDTDGLQSARLRPRLIIVESTLLATDKEETLVMFLEFLNAESSTDLSLRFSAVEIVLVEPEGIMSTYSRYRSLSERLLDASREAGKIRLDSQYLLSSPHFYNLLTAGLSQYCTSRQPLDFIELSRVENPMAPDLREHLSNFLRNISTPRELLEVASPIIASSFLMDSYPPHAHGTYPFSN